jgi:aquaporin related protein
MPNRLSGSFKTALVIAVGEFCGTFMFLLLSFMGAQTALNSSGGNLDAPTLLYIASSFGTALAVNVWVFYRVTGGMFNPAVSLLSSHYLGITPSPLLLSPFDATNKTSY